MKYKIGDRVVRTSTKWFPKEKENRFVPFKGIVASSWCGFGFIVRYLCHMDGNNDLVGYYQEELELDKEYYRDIKLNELLK